MNKYVFKRIVSCLLALIMLIGMVPALNISASKAEVAQVAEFTGTTADGLEYEISDGVVEITNYSGEAAELIIPSTIDEYPVTSIGDYAFYRCTSLKNITIPEGVTSIGYQAFCYCSSLESITIPEGVTRIDNGAFSWCESLESITIPSSVTDIGFDVFDGTAYYKNPDNWQNGVLYIGPALIKAKSLSGDYTIKSGTTVIANAAFDNCSGLKNITIPSSVTNIGDDAFSYCDALESITIPESVTSIGDDAFYYCSSLESIGVDEDNPVYDSRDNCNAIIETVANILIRGGKATVIPSTVTSIGDGAFSCCESLESITIPEGVTSIGDRAFEECSSLKSITIPEGVTWIGFFAFGDCESLESITVDENNSVYDSRDNCNAIIDTATNTLIHGCKNTVIPSGVTRIYQYAFYGTSLESIIIPESVTSIGDSAFSSCTDIYYIGTEEQWNKIYIEGEDILCLLNIHYEYVPTEPGTTVPTGNQGGDDPAETYLLGDANSDGKVNVKDATFIQKAAASLIVLDDMQVLAADVNEDKTVNVKDATAIQKFVASIPVKFPIGEKKHLSRT